MTCPYKFVKNDLFGRYLVAARDLKQGEVIIKEEPIQVGPQNNAFPICFKCCTQLHYKITNPSCPNCQKATICSTDCKGNLHKPGECESLKPTKITPDDFLKNPQIIIPLRLILLRNYDPKSYTTLLQLEPHLPERRDTYIWRTHKFRVEDVLRELEVLTEDDLKEELVQKVCGILDVNAFEVRPVISNRMLDPSECLRGLFMTAALMAHDCTPNTHLSVDENFEMTIRASSAIPENGAIFFNYASGLEGSVERRKHLKEGKYFDCSCQRCSDSSENGSDISAIICTKCKIGLVYCTEPLKDAYSVNWQCKNCQMLYKGGLVKTTINLSKEIIHDYSNLQEAERLMDKLKLTLGPRHYLLLELKQNVVSILGNYDGCEETKKKIQLCEELLQVLAVLEPGISRHQAITQYELHKAKSKLAYEEYTKREINSKKYLEKLREAEGILKSSMKALLYEPKFSPEGRLAQKAMNDLRILRGTSSDIERILKLDNAKP